MPVIFTLPTGKSPPKQLGEPNALQLTGVVYNAQLIPGSLVLQPCGPNT